jgi:acetylcholinesterase
MIRALLPLIPFLLFTTSIYAQDSTPSSTPPTATLDQATVTGISTSGVHKFLGIPYASPPVNDLRFASPQPVTSYNGSINATQFGYSCPQQNASLTSHFFGGEMSMKPDSHWADVDFDNTEAPPENEDCAYMSLSLSLEKHFF